MLITKGKCVYAKLGPQSLEETIEGFVFQPSHKTFQATVANSWNDRIDWRCNFVLKTDHYEKGDKME